MSKIETFLEFPAESMSRADFRRLIKHLKSFKGHEKWFLGNDGRKLNFAFETEAQRDSFLTEVEQMFMRRHVDTQKKIA